MITFTEEAQKQILKALENHEGKDALRIEARAQGAAEFVYAMKLVTQSDRADDDVLVDAGGFSVLVDPRSAGNLEGTKIDFEEGVLRSGFKFDNPNKPEVPQIGSGPRGDLSGDTATRVEHLISTEINQAVAAHGGRVNFLGVKEDKVYLSFGGGCHGCGMVDVTLKHGIEARIKELIPEIVEVVDVTDHATGENPFYS